MSDKPSKWQFLFDPVHPASLGMARIFFGFFMIIQCFRLKGYIVEVLTLSKYRITYDFFHWIPLFPKPLLNGLFYLFAFLSLLIMLGILTRVAAFFAFFIWTYFFLVCQGHYNNHYYLISLFFLFFIFVNSEAWGSIRNKIKKPKSIQAIPYWNLGLFKFQIAVVYFYGGIAKLNKDWFNGYPMKIWLSWKEDIPIMGPFLKTEAAVYLFSYGGVVFDLSIVFLLINKKTRILAVFLLMSFHLSNHFIWNIGVFPWLMMALTILFFEPDLADRWWNKITKAKKKTATKTKQKKKKKSSKPKNLWTKSPLSFSSKQKKITVFFLSVFVLFQLLFPLRHFVLYRDTPAWHGMGDYFSWRMMLTDRTSAIRYKIGVPGEGIVGYLSVEDYLVKRQLGVLAVRPKCLVRFAKFIGDEMAANANIPNPEVYVTAWRTVNMRPHQLQIDSTLNLTNVAYPLVKHPDWVLPMEDLPYRKEMDTLTEEELKNMGIQ